MTWVSIVVIVYYTLLLCCAVQASTSTTVSTVPKCGYDTCDTSIQYCDTDREVCLELCGVNLDKHCTVGQRCKKRDKWGEITRTCEGYCLNECSRDEFCDKNTEKCEPCHTVCEDYYRKTFPDCRIHCYDIYARLQNSSMDEINPSLSTVPPPMFTAAFGAPVAHDTRAPVTLWAIIIIPLLMIVAAIPVYLVYCRRLKHKSRVTKDGGDHSPPPGESTPEDIPLIPVPQETRSHDNASDSSSTRPTDQAPVDPTSDPCIVVYVQNTSLPGTGSDHQASLSYHSKVHQVSNLFDGGTESNPATSPSRMDISVHSSDSRHHKSSEHPQQGNRTPETSLSCESEPKSRTLVNNGFVSDAYIAGAQRKPSVETKLVDADDSSAHLSTSDSHQKSSLYDPEATIHKSGDILSQLQNKSLSSSMDSVPVYKDTSVSVSLENLNFEPDPQQEPDVPLVLHASQDICYSNTSDNVITGSSHSREGACGFASPPEEKLSTPQQATSSHDDFTEYRRQLRAVKDLDLREDGNLPEDDTVSGFEDYRGDQAAAAAAAADADPLPAVHQQVPPNIAVHINPLPNQAGVGPHPMGNVGININPGGNMAGINIGPGGNMAGINIGPGGNMAGNGQHVVLNLDDLRRIPLAPNQQEDVNERAFISQIISGFHFVVYHVFTLDGVTVCVRPTDITLGEAKRVLIDAGVPEELLEIELFRYQDESMDSGVDG